MYKNIIKIIAFVLLLISNIEIHAITPRNDWYAGIFLGPSATSGSKVEFDKQVTISAANVTLSTSAAQTKYTVLGGIGGQIGHRFCDKFRVEGEWYYNNNPISTLELYNYSLTNSVYPAFDTVNVPVQTFESINTTSNTNVQGDTNTGALMLNVIYDLLTINPNSDGYNKISPFVGAGAGYAFVQNAMQIYRRTTIDPANDPYPNREVVNILQQRYIYAGQAMVGINYFMDDFTWFGIDFRYFTTGSSIARSKYTFTNDFKTPPDNIKTVSSNISLFNNKTQILSANLSFSGTLNFL